VYTGLAGLVLLTVAYILPDLRRIETPWDRSFPLAMALIAFPILSLVWGVIGVIGKQYRADAGKAFIGIILSLLTFGMAYADFARDEPVDETTTPVANERMQMTPQELKEWRSQKLRR
jgi:hypothetical protein